MRVFEKWTPYFSGDPKIVVWQMDLTQQCFAEVSGNAERLLGYPEAAWYEAGFWLRRIHPDDLEDVVSFRRTSLETGQNFELEYRVINASGETVWLHELAELGGRETPDACHGYFMDISQRVRHEQDIARFVAYQARFLRFIGDDFSAGLRSASSYGELLERHLSQQEDHVGCDYALGLRDAIERLHQLSKRVNRNAAEDAAPTKDLLDMIRVDAKPVEGSVVKRVS